MITSLKPILINWGVFMPALVSTWSVANILKLPSSEGTVQYTLHGMSTTMAAGPAKNPYAVRGEPIARGWRRRPSRGT